MQTNGHTKLLRLCNTQGCVRMRIRKGISPPPPPSPPSGGGLHLSRREIISTPPPPKGARPETHAPKRKASHAGHALKPLPRSVKHVAPPYKEGDKAPPPSPPSRGGVLHLSRREIISTPPPLTAATPRNTYPEA